MKLNKIFGYCLTALIVLSGLYLYVWRTTDTQAVSPFRPPASCDTLEAPELSVLGDSSIQLGGYVNLRYKYFPQDNTGCGYNNCHIIPATIPNSGNLTFSGNGTVDPTDPAYRLIRTTPVEDTDYKIICSTNPSACNCRKESEPVHINVYHMRLYTDDDVYYFESDTLQTHINWEIDSRLHDCSLTADPSVNGLPISPITNGRLPISLSDTTTLKLTCFDSVQTEISKTIYIAKKDCENQEICLRAYMKTPPPAGQVFTVNKDSHIILKYNIKHSGYNTCTLSTIPAQPILPVQEMVNGEASVRYVSEITKNYTSLEAGDYEFPGFGWGAYSNWDYITVSQDTKFQLVCHGVDMTVDEYAGGEGEGGYAICQANSDGTGGTIIYADCSGCRALGGTMKCTPAGSGCDKGLGENISCGAPQGCVGGTCLVPTGDPNTSRLEVMHPTGATRHVATFTAMDFTTVTVGSVNNKCDISENTYSCKANGNTEASCDSSNLSACCSDSSVYGSGYQCTTGTCQAGSDKGQSFCNSGEKCCRPASCSDYGTGYQCTTGSCQAGSDKGQFSCNTNQKCCIPSSTDTCVIESVNMVPASTTIDNNEHVHYAVTVTTSGTCSANGLSYTFDFDNGYAPTFNNKGNSLPDTDSHAYTYAGGPIYTPKVTVVHKDGSGVIDSNSISKTARVEVRLASGLDLTCAITGTPINSSTSKCSSYDRTKPCTFDMRYVETKTGGGSSADHKAKWYTNGAIVGSTLDIPPLSQSIGQYTCGICGSGITYSGQADSSNQVIESDESNNNCDYSVNTCPSPSTCIIDSFITDTDKIFLGKNIHLSATVSNIGNCNCYLTCDYPSGCGLVSGGESITASFPNKQITPTDTYKTGSYKHTYTLTCSSKEVAECSSSKVLPVYVLPIPWWREIVTNLTAYLNGIFISK